MMKVSLTARAPVPTVYRVLVDVTDWPNWTESMSRVEILDDRALQVGSRVRIEQPRLGTNTWTVTALDPDREFTWVAHNPGVTTTARHVLTQVEEGTRIDLSLAHTGPFAWLARLLTDKTSRTYIDLEARGLKAAAEARARVD